MGGQIRAGSARIFLAGAVLALGAPAYAQVAPGAGVPTRDVLEGVTASNADTVRPRLTLEGGIERSPCALADPQYADVTVTISRAEFNNIRGVTEADLAPAWQPFVGREAPIAVLCEIRDAAATILRNRGYLAAAQVPTQRIENGVVRFELIYGHITAIRARGDTQGVERKLEQYLGRLAGQDVFNRFEAERYLLLSRDLPGYDVRLRLIPVEGEIGALIGEVTVQRQPYALDLTVQNLGSTSVGRFGGQVRAQAFGLLGMGDATSLSYFASADFAEQHILQATHQLRPGAEGLMVSGQLTYAWTRPDLGIANVVPGAELKAETLSARLSARFPLVRAQAESLYIGGGFDLVDQDVELIVPIARDRLRVGWLRLQHDFVDVERRAPRYRGTFSAELRQGFDMLGASEACLGAGCPAGFVNPGRLDGNPDATVLRLAATIDFALSETLALTLRPRAQLASSGLLGFEEFTAGNYGSGRGYDPGTIIGDDGLGVSFELKTAGLPLSDRNADNVQPFVFLDMARVWNRDATPSQAIYSTGLGARWSFDERFVLDTTLAVPLEKSGLLVAPPDVRFLVTLSTRLLPWRR